jgi:hypothetical protein
MALMGLQATSAASSAVGAYSSARAARTQGRINAMMAEVEAADALSRSASEAAKVQSKGRRAAGRSRAEAAGSGFTTGVGTAGNIESSVQFLADLDAAAIRESGRREAVGYQTQAAFSRAQAGSVSPWADAGGSLVGSAAKVGGYWAERRRPKVN